MGRETPRGEDTIKLYGALDRLKETLGGNPFLRLGSITKAGPANFCIFRNYTFCVAEGGAAVNAIEGFGSSGGQP